MKTTKTNAVGRFVLNLFCLNCDAKIESCYLCEKKFNERDFIHCVGGTKYGKEGDEHLCLDCYNKDKMNGMIE